MDKWIGLVVLLNVTLLEVDKDFVVVVVVMVGVVVVDYVLPICVSHCLENKVC